MARSNQPKSYSPGRASTAAHAEDAEVTIVTLDRFMSAMSSSHVDSGHCSGL